MKYKLCFMFPLKNLARKGLTFLMCLCIIASKIRITCHSDTISKSSFQGYRISR